MDTFHLFETEGHEELDVGSGIGVVRQFLVVVETVFLVAESECFVPTEAELLPVLEPFEFLARTHEELHLHLLELAHTEYELPCHDLVAEGFTDLRNTEGHFHASCFLYIEEVDEDTLCGLRTEVDFHSAVGGRTHLGGEHEVELAYIRPVACAGDRANDLFVEDDLLEFVKVVVVHRLGKTCVQCFAFGDVLFHALVGLFVEFLVERVTETLARFLYLFGDLVVVFGDLVLDEYICAVTLFGIAVVNQRVVEGVHVS